MLPIQNSSTTMAPNSYAFSDENQNGCSDGDIFIIEQVMQYFWPSIFRHISSSSDHQKY